MKWLVLASVCVLIGWSVGHDGREQVVREVKVPGPVKTVEVPSAPEIRTVVPESCKTVVSLSARRVKAAEEIDKSSAAQLDIISKIRVIMAGSRDVGELNKLETTQRQLQGKTVASVYEISRTELPYKEAVKKCDEETK